MENDFRAAFLAIEIIQQLLESEKKRSNKQPLHQLLLHFEFS